MIFHIYVLGGGRSSNLVIDSYSRFIWLRQANLEGFFLSHSPRTGPPAIAMRVSVMTIGGRELASIDEDCTRTKMFICVRIPGLVGPLLFATRLLYAGDKISDRTSLSMLGDEHGACIRLVLDRRGRDVAFTTSWDSTTKL